MKYIFIITVLAYLLVFTGCGEDPSGPGKDPTASVLEVEFTGEMNCNSRNRVSLQMTRQNSDVLEQESCLELQGTCLVTANWSICPDTDFISYVLYRSTSPDISEHPDEAQILCFYTDIDQHTFVDDSLNWETHYYYVLRTANEAGNYAWSNEANLTTPSEGNPPTPSVLSVVFLDKAGNDHTRNESEYMTERLAAFQSGRGTCQTAATWTRCPDDYFGSYTLYRSFSPHISEDTTYAVNLGNFTTPEDTIFTDTGVTWETTYYYALCTRNTGSGAAWSNEYGLTTPDQSEIDVTEPSSSTIWEVGQSNTLVEWVGGGAQVKLEVWYAGEYVTDFSGWMSNTGSYTRSAPIPTAWGIGQYFRIRVVDSGTPPGDGLSKEFQIYDDIEVTQPNLETMWAWEQEDVTVEWNEPYSDSVYISVYKGGSCIGTFSDWVPNTGSYTRDVPIPSSWGTGDDYTVKVEGSLGSTGFSDVFSIWAMSIIEPDSSTLWIHYQTDTQILWVSGPGSNVRMEVWQGDMKVDDFCGWTPDDGEYTRTEAIPEIWGTGNDFQLKMIDDLDNVAWSSEFNVLEPWPDSVVTTVAVGGNPISICTLPSGEYLYVANGDYHSVSVIRTSDNTVIATVAVGQYPYGICSLPSGEYVYVTSRLNSSVYVIRTSDNTVVATVGVGDNPFGICSHPSGESVYVTNFAGHTVSVIRTSDNTVVSTVEVGGTPNRICSLPSGEYVYLANSNVPVIRTLDNTVVATVDVGGSWGICSLPSGEYVYVTSLSNNTVSVIRTANNTIVSTVDVGNNPYDICSLPSGEYMYVTNFAANTVSVIRTACNTVVSTMEVGTNPNGICSLPSGEYVYVTNSVDNTVSVIH